MDNSLCFWQGERCTLTRNFVSRLPGLLGTAATRSASILAAAALRAVACANFTGQPECLAAVSYNCEWDAVSSSCGLADLLDTDGLRGVAYCPGSRMEAAVNCTLLSASGEEACSSSPYNCTTVQVAQLPGSAGLAASGLGDRLYDMVANTMLGVMVKSVSGADQLTSALMALLSGLPNSVQIPTAAACVPRWATESSTASSIFNAVKNAIKGRSDVLSQLLGPELLGDCEGVQGLRTTVESCPNATTKLGCETFKGCGWQDVGQACTVTADLLPSLVLDPTDRWVEVLNTASTACGNLTDALSCADTTNINTILSGLGDVAKITNGGSGSGGAAPPPGGSGTGGGSPYGTRGGDGGGGGAVAARGVLSTGTLVGLVFAALVGMEAVRAW